MATSAIQTFDPRQHNRRRRSRPHHHFRIVGMRQRATISRNCTPTVCIEQFPTSSGLSTRYTATSMKLCIRSFHSHGKRKKTTSTMAFDFTKPFLQSFNEQYVARVDCQMAAIGAFKDVFGCRIRLCLFHQNQYDWKAASMYKLAAGYNSMANKRLHIWIRRWLSLPFLPE